MVLDVADLRESKEFLNDLYENVTSAIFLADREARLVHFNDAFKTLFYKPEDALIGQLCGNAIGCVFPLEEGVDCGQASNCSRCRLRANILKSFTERVPVYKVALERVFEIGGRRLRKHFSFTTKFQCYRGAEYVLVLVDDVTELVEAREELERRNAELAGAVETLVGQLAAEAGELGEATAGREELARELRHRVGNVLQVVSALVRDDVEEGAAGAPLAAARIAAVQAAYACARYEEGRVSVGLRDFARAIGGSAALLGAGGIGVAGAGEGGGADGAGSPVEGTLGLDEAIAFGIAAADLARCAGGLAGARLVLDAGRMRLCLVLADRPDGASGREGRFRLARMLVERAGGEFRLGGAGEGGSMGVAEAGAMAGPGASAWLGAAVAVPFAALG
ncbi:MAG: PAS domain-containing protein [Spirochaetaceae bacterium]|nr:PAS domain-containing protein [Spirochaetaceae bacterium]